MAGAKKGNGQPNCTLRNAASIFRNLAHSIVDVAKTANVDPASVRRIRDGDAVRRTTGIKIIDALNKLANLGLTPQNDLIDA